jgi:PQQ-dependent dehydrogenase (methanol/ethanol family)
VEILMSRAPRPTNFLLLVVLVLAACGSEETAPVDVEVEQPRYLDDPRLVAAEAEPGSWLTHGRTYAEQRFSPLDSVNESNVSNLIQTWGFSTGMKRGHEATPIVVDGTMYLTSSWSVVFALDAASGELKWKWDPNVPREFAKKACCDVVNRGVAVQGGRVFVGVFDGRLAALDAATGEPLWQVVTVDQSQPYSITGAPRIVKGRVIIGNGGAEFGVRGYVSAYDPEDGSLLWRVYTVPGDPSKPFESDALATAADTWTGEWWKIGGGGTAWDSMAYDPELDLLYVGTGNGSPWARHIRSPGGGDNLYLSSILALRPDTGELVWHYQTTPGDNWDFTATQHMILAELDLAGTTRRVIMQAPKNGFFYVLDRETGELISAEKYVTVTWASHVDPETGKPVEVVGQDYKESLALVRPTAFGGHNWQPMSYSPKTGLVYIPAQEIQGAYRLDEAFEFRPGEFNTGTDMNVFALSAREDVSGHLLAWDPVRQKEAWRQQHGLAWNGGTLATAGNLVFQGTADGRFVAYAADDGQKLWEVHAGTGVMAAPVSYEIDGVQYVTVVAGWGGAFALGGGDAAAAAGVQTDGRVLTFALRPPFPEAADVEALITAGGEIEDAQKLFHTYCARCHGGGAVGGGVLADLRKSSPEVQAAFGDIVLKGIFTGKGMPSFSQWLSEDDVAALQRYVRHQAETTL